jgi:hypothetical protein
MKCTEVRIFLSQLYDRAEPVTPVPPADLEYLSANGYVLMVTKDDYEKRANDVARLSQIITQLERSKLKQPYSRIYEKNTRSYSISKERRKRTSCGKGFRKKRPRYPVRNPR